MATVVKDIVQAIEERQDKVDQVSYGQVILTIQNGRVVRVDIHQSDLIKQKG
jgi:hypothetical protein